MADYIYLLENRLSPAQRSALRAVREVARAKGLTVFLVGGAVRDLTSGSPVRDLDVVVQGNALKLKKDLEKAGGVLTGELDAAQALYFVFPGSVRMEVGSTLSVTFPKPGKPVMKPATILDDLRRRDFTANAMALSLNEGSYGLLMDPLNGVADIENRELRLVSNYGFIEDPVRMIRAARLMARLGWSMDEKTQARYEAGQQEGYISVLSEFLRGYESEEIVHEEDPLRVLKRLEAEGWMKVLAPYWTSAKVNTAELERLRDAQAQLQMQGIQADTAAASFPLLTAKLSAKEVATLKAGFVREGFVREIEALEGEAKEFATQLSGKAASTASQSWKMLMAAKPEAVLWMAYSTKSPALQAKLKSFYTEWPQARQRMPYQLMQEMRITPDVSGYEELLEKLFFELMDGKLTTPEEMKAFLEPYSPPAPPPPVNMRRLRAQKKDSKGAKARAKKVAVEEEPAEDEGDPEDLSEAVQPDETTDADEDSEPEEVVPTAAAPVKSVPAKAITAPATPAKKIAAKSVPEKEAAVQAQKASPKQVPGKKVAAKTAPPKPAFKSSPAKGGGAATGLKAKALPAKAGAASKSGPVKKALLKSAKASVKAAAKRAAPVKASKPPVKTAKAAAKATKPPAKKAAAKSQSGRKK